MRTAYRDQLNQLTHDLLLMADFVRTSMESATHALLHADLAEAERIVGSIDAIEDLREQADTAAFELLALEAPVARDLRQVVAGQRIVGNLTRMAALSVHVAKMARRRHPNIAVPEQLRPYISEMSRLGVGAAQNVKDILVSADTDKALRLVRDDDAVDDIHQHIFQLTTQRDWPYTVREAVDITLLSRFLERYSDHAVSIGQRVVFMVTGMRPEDYIEQQQTEEEQLKQNHQFDEIKRRYFGEFG
ncbi:phosphate signaling complex protein PhoU [Corynebacterium falsenii]|uniref:Phosphate-specific transport system accessory protein PhoU n=1 Tax=Corynebacterium falsenii TaxID=108486 RepID=A0A418Q608_9CORY|nr:phosphate signaling complex protein PhoU [Corynebacterium falsenii]MDC7104100.1 phosphate signaling complex protein PhoU [Corynebacterium falsenii]RIX34239.1 phosphate transport system regulatory protein PhoU [Corynebacterium falsenii]UBI06654.1 phosphate signaling complex protein PhoU [Corynebacterium falsenii]HJF13070.1 phosphate signaling complex protein PhoU [Corynebacterium falsenii]